VIRPTLREVAALAVGLLAVAGVVVLLAVYAPRWWSGDGGSYAPRGLVASTSVEPRYSQLADIVTLRAHVMVDRRAIDPRIVALDARFSPFRLMSQARRVRPVGGRAARVDYTFRIQCVSPDCLAAAGKREASGAILTTPILLRPARVVAKLRNGTSMSRPLVWPGIVVGLRLTPEEVKNGEPGIGPFPTPPRSYAISPNLAGALFLAAGVLLALVAGFLLAGALRGKRVPLRLRVPAHLTPLERALELVRVAAREETEVEARKALERLAAELRRSGRPDLTDAAGRLAWSSEQPSPAAVEELVVDVSRSLNGG
jgi:hypothetical protein